MMGYERLLLCCLPLLCSSIVVESPAPIDQPSPYSIHNDVTEDFGCGFDFENQGSGHQIERRPIELDDLPRHRFAGGLPLLPN